MRRLFLTVLTSVTALFAAAPAASAHAPDPYARADAGCGALAYGQPVQVFWGSTWWDATVVATQGPSTLIHYAGWPSSWDEWVDPSRLRLALPLAPARPFQGLGQRFPVYRDDAPYVWSVPRNTPADSAARWRRVRATGGGYRAQWSR